MTSKKESKSLAQAVLEQEESFQSHLTDVGCYCIGGLCAVTLVELFPEEVHVEFKKSVLQKILKYLDQPKQTNDSLLEILEGDVVENGEGFVDSLLKEECVAGKQQLLVADLIAVAISDGCYDARMRTLVKYVSWQLKVSWDDVEIIEEDLADTLESSAYVSSEEEKKEKAKKARNRKIKRYALIGLATIGGGAIIGLTGGLAAPLVAAGAGAIIGGAGAAALGSAAGVAIIGSLFGVAGAGLTGYKMKKRVGAVEEFTFEPLTVFGTRLNPRHAGKQLHITIAVTGWINDKVSDFREPWSCLAESKEQYSLRWESKYLHQMGEAFDYILQSGLSYATTEALKMTILSGILTAVAWPAGLMSAANVIDNPWHVCTQRSVEAGKQLAEVLLAREQGKRPVTLIGFSLGARVIFSCLEELSKRKGGEGLVEDAILLGAPVSADPKSWQLLEKVVAGKVVNGYSRGDWLLKFLFRTASVTLKVAGLSPVKWENRRMHNIDLSNVISGHGDYLKNLDTILKAVGVRTKDEIKYNGKKSSSNYSVKSSDSKETSSETSPTNSVAAMSESTYGDKPNMPSTSGVEPSQEATEEGEKRSKHPEILPRSESRIEDLIKTDMSKSDEGSTKSNKDKSDEGSPESVSKGVEIENQEEGKFESGSDEVGQKEEGSDKSEQTAKDSDKKTPQKDMPELLENKVEEIKTASQPECNNSKENKVEENKTANQPECNNNSESQSAN